jgi:membrane protein DedA with SNARE-associated domain
MEEQLSSLTAHLAEVDPVWAYGLLALSAFLENVIPPVPGDTVVVFSAYLAGRGALAWPPVYAATCLGGTAGFTVMYYLGLTRGRAFLTGRRQRLFTAERLARAEAWLERYGSWLILANRFLSGVRSVIALSAGLGGVRWRRVVLLGLVSMAIWNGLLLYAGMQVGQRWESVVGVIGQYNRLVVGLLLLVLGGVLACRWRRRRLDSTRCET